MKDPLNKVSQNFTANKVELNEMGFSIVDDIYTEQELSQISNLITQADTDKPTFRKSEDLFAIRQFLKELPDVKPLIFNANLKKLLDEVGNGNAFVIKSIYFDKPEKSNWYVAYHQDLTISVNKKVELENFGPWTVKHQQFSVQPPLELLERNFTIRIHLDDTSRDNGALKVIPKSHLRGICRLEHIDWESEREVICEVQKGGVMLMKPLILHGSNRTVNGQKRRVVHIEFSEVELPQTIQWSEKLNYN